MAYTVIRTDLMSGTKQPSDLISIRFYDNENKVREVENGTIVEFKGYEEGSYDILKAVAATETSNISDCAIVAGVEVNYDERKRNLDEYINEAGKAVRCYIPRSRNIFSVTKEAFVNGAAPVKDAAIGIGANGKLDAAKAGFGVCVGIEAVGRYTYYVIKIDNTEAAKAIV